MRATTVMEIRMVDDDTGHVIAEGTDEADESILDFNTAELISHGIANVRVETRIKKVILDGTTVTFDHEE